MDRFSAKRTVCAAIRMQRIHDITRCQADCDFNLGSLCPKSRDIINYDVSDNKRSETLHFQARSAHTHMELCCFAELATLNAAGNSQSEHMTNSGTPGLINVRNGSVQVPLRTPVSI